MALPPEMLMFESPTAMDLFGFCRNGNFGDTWGCYSRSPGGSDDIVGTFTRERMREKYSKVAEADEGLWPVGDSWELGAASLRHLWVFDFYHSIVFLFSVLCKTLWAKATAFARQRYSLSWPDAAVGHRTSRLAGV